MLLVLNKVNSTWNNGLRCGKVFDCHERRATKRLSGQGRVLGCDTGRINSNIYSLPLSIARIHCQTFGEKACHPERSEGSLRLEEFYQAVRRIYPVILSEAKDLVSLPQRSFAALRMTARTSKCLIHCPVFFRRTHQCGKIFLSDRLGKDWLARRAPAGRR